MRLKNSHSSNFIFLNLTLRSCNALVSIIRKPPYHSYPQMITTIRHWKTKLPVLVIASGIFSTLEANTCTTAQSVADADDTYTTPPTLAEFNTAQCAEEFCKNAVRQLGQAETEFTLNKARQTRINRWSFTKALAAVITTTPFHLFTSPPSFQSPWTLSYEWHHAKWLLLA